MRLRKFLASIAVIVLLLVTLLSDVPSKHQHLTLLRSALAKDDGLIPVQTTRDKIAFAQGQEIFLANPDGSNLRQLTFSNSETTNYQPALSPDGTRIAFGTHVSGKSEIVVMNTDGSGEIVELTTTIGSYNGEPSWSPDGTRLAFVRGGDPTSAGLANSDTCGSDVYIVTVDNRMKLTSVTRGEGGSDPTWSPDGTELAFISMRTGNYEIFKYKFIDGKSYQLTYTPENEAEPSWSPDGTKILYARGYLNAQSDCGFAHTGLGQIALVDGPDIFVMSADGSDQVALTGTGNCYDPVWSPDGASICFISFANGDTQLFRLDQFFKDPYPITTHNGEKSSPSWSR